MKSILAFLLTTAATASAATIVSVLDFGNNVRRTTTKKTESSVADIASFWNALHYKNQQQAANMPVIPDMFSRPEGAVVVGLTGNGVDLDSMPNVNRLSSGQDDDEDVVRGHLVVDGRAGKSLLNKMGPARIADAKTLVQHCQHAAAATSPRVSAVSVKVDSDNAAEVDEQIQALVTSLQGRNVVVHLVVEEEEGAARRRLATRRLNDADGDEEDGDEDGDDNNNNNNNGNNNNQKQYGYYDSQGNFVSTQKSIFQIQYFNVVLWTSVALIVALSYSIWLMMHMPLEADTLLFGESAKMVGS